MFCVETVYSSPISNLQSAAF